MVSTTWSGPCFASVGVRCFSAMSPFASTKAVSILVPPRSTPTAKPASAELAIWSHDLRQASPRTRPLYWYSADRRNGAAQRRNELVAVRQALLLGVEDHLEG